MQIYNENEQTGQKRKMQNEHIEEKKITRNLMLHPRLVLKEVKGLSCPTCDSSCGSVGRVIATTSLVWLSTSHIPGTLVSIWDPSSKEVKARGSRLSLAIYCVQSQTGISQASTVSKKRKNKPNKIPSNHVRNDLRSHFCSLPLRKNGAILYQFTFICGTKSNLQHYKLKIHNGDLARIAIFILFH